MSAPINGFFILRAGWLNSLSFPNCRISQTLGSGSNLESPKIGIRLPCGLSKILSFKNYEFCLFRMIGYYYIIFVLLEFVQSANPGNHRFGKKCFRTPKESCVPGIILPPGNPEQKTPFTRLDGYIPAHFTDPFKAKKCFPTNRQTRK